MLNIIIQDHVDCSYFVLYNIEVSMLVTTMSKQLKIGFGALTVKSKNNLALLYSNHVEYWRRTIIFLYDITYNLLLFATVML